MNVSLTRNTKLTTKTFGTVDAVMSGHDDRRRVRTGLGLGPKVILLADVARSLFRRGRVCNLIQFDQLLDEEVVSQVGWQPVIPTVLSIQCTFNSISVSITNYKVHFPIVFQILFSLERYSTYTKYKIH